MGLRGRVRRLERKAKGNTVRIEQVDGTTRTFPAEAFWLGLFVAATDAACGVVPEGPIADAVHNATPRELERLERMAAAGVLGGFLRRAVACGGLLEVADPVEDLSEPP